MPVQSHTLTRDEVARVVAKASANPHVTPGLALKLDIIGRHKPLRGDKAKRDEGFDRLRKVHGRQALAELGPEYFIEARRAAASPSEPGPHRRRGWLALGS
jgi:hypothetical protein